MTGTAGLTPVVTAPTLAILLLTVVSDPTAPMWPLRSTRPVPARSKMIRGTSTPLSLQTTAMTWAAWVGRSVTRTSSSLGETMSHQASEEFGRSRSPSLVSWRRSVSTGSAFAVPVRADRLPVRRGGPAHRHDLSLGRRRGPDQSVGAEPCRQFLGGCVGSLRAGPARHVVVTGGGDRRGTHCP